MSHLPHHRFVTALAAILISAAAAIAAPDMIYHHANIHTGDPARPRAAAVAIEEGRFVAVGSNAEVLALADQSTTLIDLAGQTVLPGLIDAHGHVSGLGSLYAGVVDLSQTTSFDEVIELVTQTASQRPAGTWILGRGWDHESWEPDARGVRPLPTHTMLSEATPDHPVYLMRVDGHASLANAHAMRVATITRNSASLPGGEIVRDERGEPTGVFVDNAEFLITEFIPTDAAGRFDTLVMAAQNALLAQGITGVHDMGVTPAEVMGYQTLAAMGRLIVRIDAAVPAPLATRYFTENEPFTTDTLTVRATKAYMDGAMGSRGAWLLEPYADRATDDEGNPYTGLAVSDPADLEALAQMGMERGFQVWAHAIGDRANREVLDAFERAHASYARASGPGSPTPPHDAAMPNAPRMGVPVRSLDQFRFRIEHAQLLHPDDLPRFTELGVIASMQPRHATSDMRWVADRVGNDRAQGAYAWASLLQSGAVLAFGSDFPVEPFNPFRGFYSAITRQDEMGSPEGGWMPQERVTRTEALHAFTLGAAYAAFHENDRGSITAGKLADLIVIDRDIMTIEPSAIPGTVVLRTIIGGDEVYAKPQD